MGNRGARAGLAAVTVILASAGLLGQSHPSKPGARTAAPDLTGVWRRARRAPDKTRQYTVYELAGILPSPAPPMTSWAEEKYKAAKPNIGPRGVPVAESNDPVNNCAPPGVPRIYTSRLGAPFEIIQVPGRVIMLFEYDHFIRQIYIDGRKHPEDVNPSWMGDSVGHWEGDTLVVDTIGFNDKTWIDSDGHPHSDQLHVVERIHRTSHDTMIDDMTIEDPKAYTKPWVSRSVFELKAGWSLMEYVCEDSDTFNDMEKLTESGK